MWCGAREVCAAVLALALGGCGGSNSVSSKTPPAKAQVRFVEGAPVLEALVNGVPTGIGESVYLTANGATVASSFGYGTRTPFVPVPAAPLSLIVANSLGYAVGPVKTSMALTSGKSYTVILIGAYPRYKVLTFEEPPAGPNATLALYEASPSFPSADFGSFTASTHSNFRKLGSAHFGNLVTVSLGKNVADFGGYAGTGTNPLNNGALSLSSVDSLDTTNVLPFRNATRLSLFVFDPGSSSGPVFGNLDL